MKLYDFQQEVLQQSKDLNKVAYYYDMGTGKTFIGAEKLMSLCKSFNLVVCQKSKLEDWKKHFKENYKTHSFYTGNSIQIGMLGSVEIFDLSKQREYENFINAKKENYLSEWDELPCLIGVINYDLLFRRPELAKLKDFTLLLDESSLIQNESSKRSKFILNKLKPANIILLSGTPTGGKYEKLYSQLYLLGYKISKSTYWNEYVEYDVEKQFNFATKQYNFYKVIKGYKNVERLKNKMAEYGCFFKKTEEVFSLPKQNFININVPASKEYKKFQKTNIVIVDETELVGDTTLNKLLYDRQLCGMYSKDKLSHLRDLLSSSDDRFIIFYNFNHEGNKILEICGELEKPLSLVNGNVKDLTKYENESNSVTLIQYQAGAMGLNLQKANKIIYFTPCLSSELFEQSKKRTHRIGQEKPCFYYQLICNNSVEEKIYETLAMRKDFTEKLFEKELTNG